MQDTELDLDTDLDTDLDIDLDDVFELIENITDYYDNNEQIDLSIFNENKENNDKINIKSSPLKLSNSSIIKMVKELNIPNISSNCVDYVSDIIYTKLYDILHISLISLDERDAKILKIQDIINSLHILGEQIICTKN